MDVKSAFRIAVAGLSIAALPVLSSAQSGQNTYDPAAGKAASRPRDGFIDFTLKQINPADQNYGQCLDKGRALLLDESVRNGFYWSNVVALSLLGCLLLIIIYQHRLETRRDWTAAQIMAEYEQALARSNAQIDQVIKSNHGLNNALAAIKEPTLRPTPKPQDSGQRASSTATEGRASSSQPAPPSPPRASFVEPPIERAAGTAATPGPAPQMATSKVDADIVARINLLEQQLAYAQEDNKQLRQRVAEGDRRLEIEQQRNRQLKGA
jgi:hypothetical protein